MEIKKNKLGNFLVIDLPVRLDTSNYQELEKSLIGVIDQGEKDIVVNCSGLNYISSSGLRVFLIALKKLSSSGGRFHLCCLQDNIQEIFEIAGFTTIFTIFSTLEEAAK